MEAAPGQPVILHYILKDKGDVLVANCVEIPAIMVYGKTKEEIDGQLRKAISSYFIAFPEQRRSIKREELKQIEVIV